MDRTSKYRALALMVLLALLSAAASAQAPTTAVPRDGYVLQAQASGEGATVVVFESGFGQGPETWDDVIADLGAECRCIAYARAGIGDSGIGDGAMDIAAHVRDLAAVIDTLAPETDVVLVGHSYGGLLATEYARAYPQRLHGLVLVDPATMGQRHAQRAADAARIAADDAMLREQLPPALFADYLALVAQLDAPDAATPSQMPAVSTVLLTATNVADEPFVFEETALGKEVWKAEHARLLAAMPRGRQQFVASGQNIQQEQPKLVADAIRAVIASP